MSSTTPKRVAINTGVATMLVAFPLAAICVIVIILLGQSARTLRIATNAKNVDKGTHWRHIRKDPDWKPVMAAILSLCGDKLLKLADVEAFASALNLWHWASQRPGHIKNGKIIKWHDETLGKFGHLVTTLITQLQLVDENRIGKGPVYLDDIKSVKIAEFKGKTTRMRLRLTWEALATLASHLGSGVSRAMSDGKFDGQGWTPQDYQAALQKWEEVGRGLERLRKACFP